jgi:hypothetical protein
VYSLKYLDIVYAVLKVTMLISMLLGCLQSFGIPCTGMPDELFAQQLNGMRLKFGVVRSRSANLVSSGIFAVHVATTRGNVHVETVAETGWSKSRQSAWSFQRGRRTPASERD